jgi:hypothetical protein
MGVKKNVNRVLRGKVKGRDNLEELCIGGRVILTCFVVGMVGCDCILLVQHRNKWWGL